MPANRRKEKNIEKKNTYELTRRPLYTGSETDKENMNFSSSDDSPEKKHLDSHSPRIPKKNSSPSSLDSLQDADNSVKRRSGIYRQNRSPQFQKAGNQNMYPNNSNSDNSDMDIEIDNSNDCDYLFDQEASENSPDIKNREHLSPKSDRYEDSTENRRRKNPPRIQLPERSIPESRSEPINFFLTPKFLIICFCIVIVPLIAYFCINILSTNSKTDQLNPTPRYLVDSLKSEFRDQPHLTFRIIHSALKNVLEAQPEAPAIILLLATNGSKTVCSNFAHKLVDSLSVPEFTVKISGKNFKLANVNKAKFDIDKKIEKVLKDNQLGSVLIDDLDQIPGQTAIILHKYYDHEYAPFKKAVFVMTVDYNKDISNYTDQKVWDKTAYDYLLSVWIDIGVDQVTALLSRLTVSVAVISDKSLK